MEEVCSYGQRYNSWDPAPYQHHAPRYNAYQSNGYGDASYGYENPSLPHPPSQNGIEEALHNSNNSSNTSNPSNSVDIPSQPLSIPKGSINTLFLCKNQEGREDTLLHEDDVESLNHEEVHECLEEVEMKNEEEEVEYENKEPKGMKIVHCTSSGETPLELPSKLHFEWVNIPDMHFLSPQHYDLLETDGQLRALCGVLDKKKMDILGLDESRFITFGESEFKAYSGHLHNNRAKVEALNLRKRLRPWQSQEKLVDSQRNGWTKFGIPEKVTIINTFGDLPLIWEFLQA
ncbi:hypothetical protein PIB30_096959 [Stylosanthes scabra]|uniref:Uncharacterized protein n=1 Tax=Stylosanthes scabra TaxID=79078 RepID=A0ABU6YXI9_9FABA|nr:hypothetical protein [Stylosanthes scabra]